MVNGGVLPGVSIPVHQLERGITLLYLLLEFGFFDVERRSRDVVMAELIVGVGRYEAEIERRIATRVVGRRVYTNVWVNGWLSAVASISLPLPLPWPLLFESIMG